MKRRIDKDGMDITGMPGLYAESDKIMEFGIDDLIIELRELVAGLRNKASSDYCRTYNTEYGRGIKEAADYLEALVEKRWVGEVSE